MGLFCIFFLALQDNLGVGWWPGCGIWGDTVYTCQRKVGLLLPQARMIYFAEVDRMADLPSESKMRVKPLSEVPSLLARVK